jgi:hypothetical protein
MRENSSKPREKLIAITRSNRSNNTTAHEGVINSTEAKEANGAAEDLKKSADTSSQQGSHKQQELIQSWWQLKNRTNNLGAPSHLGTES